MGVLGLLPHRHHAPAAAPAPDRHQHPHPEPDPEEGTRVGDPESPLPRLIHVVPDQQHVGETGHHDEHRQHRVQQPARPGSAAGACAASTEVAINTSKNTTDSTASLARSGDSTMFSSARKRLSQNIKMIGMGEDQHSDQDRDLAVELEQHIGSEAGRLIRTRPGRERELQTHQRQSDEAGADGQIHPEAATRVELDQTEEQRGDGEQHVDQQPAHGARAVTHVPILNSSRAHPESAVVPVSGDPGDVRRWSRSGTACRSGRRRPASASASNSPSSSMNGAARAGFLSTVTRTCLGATVASVSGTKTSFAEMGRPTRTETKAGSWVAVSK